MYELKFDVDAFVPALLQNVCSAPCIKHMHRPAGAGFLPLWQSRVSMVYVLFVAEMFFLFSHCTPQGAYSGCYIFSPHLPHVMLYFSSIPCLPVLSTPLSYMYVVHVWTG